MTLRSQVYKCFNNHGKNIYIYLKRTQVLFLTDRARGSIVKVNISFWSPLASELSVFFQAWFDVAGMATGRHTRHSAGWHSTCPFPQYKSSWLRNVCDIAVSVLHHRPSEGWNWQTNQTILKWCERKLGFTLFLFVELQLQLKNVVAIPLLYKRGKKYCTLLKTQGCSALVSHTSLYFLHSNKMD